MSTLKDPRVKIGFQWFLSFDWIFLCILGQSLPRDSMASIRDQHICFCDVGLNHKWTLFVTFVEPPILSCHVMSWLHILCFPYFWITASESSSIFCAALRNPKTNIWRMISYIAGCWSVCIVQFSSLETVCCFPGLHLKAESPICPLKI